MAKPKTRTYTGVFYPGEEPDPLNILVSHLKSVRIPAMVSPLHSADGQEAKPHVHFMMDYPSPVILETARADYGEVSANGYLEPVRSRKAMMRYFLHLDDEEKEQGLSADDVIVVCGAIFDPTPELSADDVVRILIELQDYCDDHRIVEYSDLCRITRTLEKYDWFRVATSHTIHFSAYFRSLRNREIPKDREN